MFVNRIFLIACLSIPGLLPIKQQFDMIQLITNTEDEVRNTETFSSLIHVQPFQATLCI